MAEVAPQRLEADVAVIGAGPAGVAAGCRAAEAGKRVVLLDESLRPGGQIWRHVSRGTLPHSARRWLDRLARSGAEVLCGASVVDARPGFELVAQGGGAPLTVRAATLVIATGARERFLPFPGWTLPNVFGIGGAQALLKQGVGFAGKRVVIAGSGPLLLPVAALLARGGARVSLVAEQAPPGQVYGFAASLWRSPARALQAVAYRAAFLRVPYRTGTWATQASGEGRVEEVAITDGGRSWTLPCDALCTGFGLVPNVELARLLGCTLEHGRVAVDAWQRTTLPDVYCAGEPTGISGVEASLAEGEIAGLAAAGRWREAEGQLARRDRARRFGARMEAAFAPREELRALPDDDTVVCRCEDVPFAQLCPRWTPRQAKLYTRAGMGPCQGRVCGPALEYLFGWQPDTVRAPVVNATVGVLAHSPPPASGSGSLEGHSRI